LNLLVAKIVDQVRVCLRFVRKTRTVWQDVQSGQKGVRCKTERTNLLDFANICKHYASKRVDFSQHLTRCKPIAKRWKPSKYKDTEKGALFIKKGTSFSIVL
jgi:hypothetical protein